MGTLKLLAREDDTMAQVIFTLKLRKNLPPAEALYFFVKECLILHSVTLSSTAAEVYEKCKDKDGYLYLIYASEETFG